ncbi:MAG: helix-turn-helix domain-containing protein, partial [Firmicutes bacterium]|nr:helix-turn-helix domain-containing protein [Bacillota bacterium]
MKNRIEELRKQKKYTQQALGDLLGVSRQTIIS